jgi:hypothetical protein
MACSQSYLWVVKWCVPAFRNRLFLGFSVFYETTKCVLKFYKVIGTTKWPLTLAKSDEMVLGVVTRSTITSCTQQSSSPSRSIPCAHKRGNAGRDGISSQMDEIPSQNMHVQRLTAALLPLDLPYPGLVTHSGEINCRQASQEEAGKTIPKRRPGNESSITS